MKKVASIAVGLVRTAIILTAIWLIAEVIHFRVTGEYMLYYRLWLRSAENAMEEIAIINEVYNVRQARWAIGFTAYFIPVIRFLAFLAAACDATSAVRFGGRKRIVFAMLSIASCLTIAVITLVPTIF
jgi:hypothetical protein